MFRMKHPTNPQSYRVWAEIKAEAPLRTALKNPANVMAWGATSAQGLTEVGSASNATEADCQHRRPCQRHSDKNSAPGGLRIVYEWQHSELENEVRDVVTHLHGG